MSRLHVLYVTLVKGAHDDPAKRLRQPFIWHLNLFSAGLRIWRNVQPAVLRISHTEVPQLTRSEPQLGALRVIEIGRMPCVAAELRAHECCKIEFDDRVRRFCCELFQRVLWKRCNVQVNRYEAQQSENTR